MLDAARLFTGLDEVWLHDRPLHASPPPDVSLVAPEQLEDAIPPIGASMTTGFAGSGSLTGRVKAPRSAVGDVGLVTASLQGILHRPKPHSGVLTSMRRVRRLAQEPIPDKRFTPTTED
jgi:hypothetical protein